MAVIEPPGGGIEPPRGSWELVWSGPVEAMPEGFTIEPGYFYAIAVQLPFRIPDITIPGIGSGIEVARWLANGLAEGLRRFWPDHKFLVVVGAQEVRVAIDNIDPVPALLALAFQHLLQLAIFVAAVLGGATLLIHVWRTTAIPNEAGEWSRQTREALEKSGALEQIATGVGAAAAVLPAVLILVALGWAFGRR